MLPYHPINTFFSLELLKKNRSTENDPPEHNLAASVPMPRPAAIQGSFDDLLVFHELARAITSNLDLEDILRTVLEYVDRFIDADLWALLMLDHQRQELYYTGLEGGENPHLSGIRIKVGEGLAGWVAQHGETLIIPEAASDPRSPSVSPGALTVRSAIGLPIRGRRGTHGVLEIFNPHLSESSDYGIAFLHILVDFAAIAIENAQHITYVEELTITDDATGLYNARHLYAVLERELEAARHESRPLSLVFLDLDRFKQVNDEHGHLIGTELLGMVGRQIRRLARATDICFRYGGDEFVILMPQTTREEALRMTRSIHTSLAAHPFRFASGLELSVASSAGISAYPGDGRTVHAILGAADNRMYAIKNSGRGRVEA
jgi:diguanylate cyclase (GGDEF)-like protein